MNETFDLTLPKVGKELLHKLQSGQINMQEFDHECASWMMSVIQYHKFIAYPIMPYEIKDYVNRKREDPNYKLSSEFWNLPQVKGYYEAFKKAFRENASNLHWLKFIKANIPTNDTVYHAKIDDCLATHQVSEY